MHQIPNSKRFILHISVQVYNCYEQHYLTHVQAPTSEFSEDTLQVQRSACLEILSKYSPSYSSGRKTEVLVRSWILQLQYLHQSENKMPNTFWEMEFFSRNWNFLEIIMKLFNFLKKIVQFKIVFPFHFLYIVAENKRKSVLTEKF